MIFNGHLGAEKAVAKQFGRQKLLSPCTGVTLCGGLGLVTRKVPKPSEYLVSDLLLVVDSIGFGIG